MYYLKLCFFSTFIIFICLTLWGIDSSKSIEKPHPEHASSKPNASHVPQKIKKHSIQPQYITSINLPNFTGTQRHIQTNGEAAITTDNLFSKGNQQKSILRLTNRRSNPDGLVAGSAFVKQIFRSNKVGDFAFSTFFRLRVTGSTIYDGSGLVFVIHADSRGPKALGKRVFGMGYAGDALKGYRSITPSFGVKFNIQDASRDIDINSVGVVVNGILRSLYPPYGYPLIQGSFNDGIPVNVWVDFDGDNLTIRTSRYAERNTAIIHTQRPMDLRRILHLKLPKNQKYPNVYVGFTADPGYYAAFHDITEWYFLPYHHPFGDYCEKSTNQTCNMFKNHVKRIN